MTTTPPERCTQCEGEDGMFVRRARPPLRKAIPSREGEPATDLFTAAERVVIRPHSGLCWHCFAARTPTEVA